MATINFTELPHGILGIGDDRNVMLNSNFNERGNSNAITRSNREISTQKENRANNHGIAGQLQVQFINLREFL